MLMKRLIRYCRGTVQFTVTGAYPERFLNLCAQGGVGLWETRRLEGGIAACCAQCHRSRLEYYAEKSGCTLTVRRCSGMRNTARRYRHRTGLWVGSGLCMAGGGGGNGAAVAGGGHGGVGGVRRSFRRTGKEH